MSVGAYVKYGIRPPFRSKIQSMRAPNIGRILLLTILLVFCLHDPLNFVAPPPGAIGRASAPGHQRSIDVVQYGFHVGETGSQYDCLSTAQAAASENLAAVAINKLSPASRIEEPNGYLEARWDVLLLVFDAKSGKADRRRLRPCTARLGRSQEVSRITGKLSPTSVGPPCCKRGREESAAGALHN